MSDDIDFSGLLDVRAGEVISLVDDGIEEPEYDPPEGSVWLIGVDMQGCVFILDTPNIHYSFFDNGYNAEDMGFPYDLVDTEAGVYRVTCSFKTSTDWESGQVDDYWFNPTKMERINIPFNESEDKENESDIRSS